MDHADAATLLYAGTLAGTAWGGGVLATLRRWSERDLKLAISLGAGVLLGATFLHLLPEIVRQDPGGRLGSVCALAGFVGIYLLEKVVMVHPCEEGACSYHRIGAASLVGLSVHNLATGLALGASLLVPDLGFVVLVALLVHKIPESFSLGTILLLGRYERREVVRWLGVYASMIVVGAVVSRIVLSHVGPGALTAALAVSAGTFLHIAVSDLLPEVHRVESQRSRNLAAFLGGLFLMAVLGSFE